MPIGFARLEFVKRSSGKNACGKAAYNSRERIRFAGSELQPSRVYDWSNRARPAYHEVLLPDGVDEKFRSPEVLWNFVEQAENRSNSQTALEMVLALPDDKAISLEDKIYLTRSFVKEHFVNKGLAAQIDIHTPEKKQLMKETGEIVESADHNWHAHMLATTRRFKENGQELDTHKARDLMPAMRNGKVISGEHWGKLWALHQNAFFEQKGLALRVDVEGVVPQKHLGPVRMRGRAFSLLHEHDLRVSLNILESEDPKNVLEKITQTKNIFTNEDVERFLHKHVDPGKVFEVRDAFWKQTQLVQLIDSQTHKTLNKFSTQEVIEEEKQTIRLADRLFQQDAHKVNLKKMEKFSSNLNPEQKDAFHNIISGKRLSCIEGYAGTGKSYLLAALKNTYESQGCVVRGFGPDSATAQILQEKGFSNAENVYRFLFALSNGKREISKKEVWILDEVGKLGTRPLLELLKCANRHGAQMILAGDSAQLPSVERGLGFKAFSDRYGAQHLVNIQRQKDDIQRDIARKLAIGEMGQALDAIVRLGNIKWTATKEESMEALLKAWAQNRATNPNESNLIIAHSNKEVRVLNELARIYRKEAGELHEKEYQCETAFGKTYFSCGDRIEFRKNDEKLGVTNGMDGILIKASEKKFTVSMQDGKQHVTFDPREYRNFQLGYATTYNRAQGNTVDKAYVLYSPQMNKERFYVGLTRHVKKALFFISEQEAKNLSDVKRQAYKQTFRSATLEYLTQNDLEKESTNISRSQEIEKLRSSDSILSKMKVLGITTWEGVRSKASKMVEQYKDQKPNREFFNPKIEQQNILGKVQEVQFEESSKIDEQKIRNDFQTIQKIAENQPIKTPKANTKEHWKKLTEDQKSILRTYFKSTDKASSLYTIVKSDADQQKNPHYQDWQQACKERNAHAYQVITSFKTKELRSLFEPKGLEILQERSVKHERLLQSKDNSKIDLDTQLKENLEQLLLKLFPEGPTKRDRKGLRFGSKGSFAVALTGSKTGSFYDFERQEGGGPLQLIQKSLSYSQAEAIAWAKDFLGQAPTIQVPSHFKTKQPEKEQEWVSLKPTNKAPSLKEISKGLTLHYKETARYTYRDVEGHILFHTLRLEDESGKKMVLPLSFGYYKGNEQEPCWSLKGYQAEKKSLYNLHLLKEFPKAKVLIVEGEKAADAATKLFPQEKMICLTWSGGAGAVNKSDWQPLFMRQIVIWPDNDKAGFEASDAICKELRRVGIKSLNEVSREILSKELPPKWDLADQLPQGKGESFIKDAILRAQEKTVGLDELKSYLKMQSQTININLAQDALCKVEENLRSSFEEKFFQKNMEIRKALLDEMMRVLQSGSQGTSIKLNSKNRNIGINLDKLEDRDMNVYGKDRGLER